MPHKSGFGPGAAHFRIGRKADAADLHLIDGAFATHMREHGYAAAAIVQYRYYLVRTADWLAVHHRRLTSVTRHEVPRLGRAVMPAPTFRPFCGALYRWLKFRQIYAVKPSGPWSALLSDFAAFLTDHRGFTQPTAEGYAAYARRYLSWQFGDGEARWDEVRPQDIWRYAERCAEGHASGYAKTRLGALRRFLGFVQLRGACSAQLVAAVPKVPNFRQHYSPGGLTNTQWKKLLRSFDRQTAQGSCEHAVALCMIDLGLRNCEVVHLRLQDLDWPAGIVRVPVMNTGVARIVPLPAAVRDVLRHYIKHFRGSSQSDRVFLRHAKMAGTPVSTHCVRMAMRRGYRRCEFPGAYGGTHVLRRTFASRLRAHGADMREIGDLLGHQDLMTTSLYTDVAVSDLRVLVQPWPLKS
ncbi:MAG: tyrosine-type recombinase/integrase [Opitutaceae bacterium]